MSEVLHPDLIAVRFEALSQAGRHEEALKLAREQLAHHLDNEWLWYFLALGLVNTGRPEESEKAVREALALVPEFLSALVLLVTVLRRQQRPDEAVEVALRTVALYPDAESAHFAVASAHFARYPNRDDLWIAFEAALHTTRLSPGNVDAFALAIRTADLLRLKEQALDLLREGLSLHPNSAALVQAAGMVDGGKKIIGDRAPLLASVLAADPLDEESADDLRLLACASLRRLLYLPWLQGILFGLGAVFVLPHRLGAAAVALALAAAVMGFFLVGFRRLERRLPRGYLRGELRTSPGLRKALGVAGAAEAWVVLSGICVALSGGSRWGAALLVLAVVPVLASQHLLNRGQYTELLGGWAQADARTRRAYWHGQVQAYVESRKTAWAGLLLGIAGLSAAGLSESDTPAVVGAGLCLAALLWLARAAYLARLQLGLGKDSPFVVGAVLEGDSDRPEVFRRRGQFWAAMYTLLIVIAPVFCVVMGANILAHNAIPDPPPSTPAGAAVLPFGLGHLPGSGLPAVPGLFDPSGQPVQ